VCVHTVHYKCLTTSPHSQLNLTLARSVRELSSIDKYKKEVVCVRARRVCSMRVPLTHPSLSSLQIFSGQLEWSAPHKSDRFWHENIDEVCVLMCACYVYVL
jgi:hypothetical protein